MSLRTLDDTDPAIRYAGIWDSAGNPEEYNTTTTFTDNVGATARVTFTGTGISVFGTIAIIGQGGPVSTYRIEDVPSASTRYQGVPKDEIQYGVNFYNASGLDLGRHVLVITNESPDAELFLDFFTVAGPDVQSSPSSIASSSSSVASSPSPSTSSNSNDEIDDSHTVPVGPIVGGVVGGLALVCLLVVGILVYKKRKRRQAHVETGVGGVSAPPVPPITPFIVAGQNPPQATSRSPDTYPSSSKSGPLSSASSSQLPPQPSFYHTKQPSASMSSPSSVPMSSASNASTFPSTSGKENIDPPPRYEQ